MNKKFTAEILLLFVAFIWGATFVIVQNAIDILPPLLFNAIRFMIAGIIILIIYLIRRKKNKIPQKNAFIAGVVLGSCLFIGYSLQTIGLLYTTPSKAGFITGLSVVMVPLLAFFILKSRPSPTAILGSIAATIGLYLLAVKNTSPFSIGDFYVLLCTFGFAFHIIFTDRLAKKLPVLLLTTIQLFTVAFLCLISAFIFENWEIILNPELYNSSSLLFALFITAILGTSIAFFIQTYSQKATSPTRVAIILAMEPVFAAITSFLWINERLSIGAVIGCILILFGMIIAELPVSKWGIFPFKKKQTIPK
ncbi:EamA family transporter [Bacillus obstructivus]|uniref:DMT family transporter n=1 Tax=Heyndrickxia oleronia TaxID=38875 RepID=UPI0009037323|nr:EamA family transporter [Bacillus obstructivus]